MKMFPADEPEQTDPTAETMNDHGLLAPPVVVEIDDAVVEALLASGAAVVALRIDRRVATFDGTKAKMLEEASGELFSLRALALPSFWAVSARALQSCSRGLGFPYERLAIVIEWCASEQQD